MAAEARQLLQLEKNHFEGCRAMEQRRDGYEEVGFNPWIDPSAELEVAELCPAFPGGFKSPGDEEGRGGQGRQCCLVFASPAPAEKDLGGFLVLAQVLG